MRKDHYDPEPGKSDPKFYHPLKSTAFMYEAFDDAVTALLNKKPGRIKGTDKQTVVETLLTVEEDGRMRPMNLAERKVLEAMLDQREPKAS